MVFLVRKCLDGTRINHSAFLTDEVAYGELRGKRFPGTSRRANENVVTIDYCFDCVFLEIAERKGEFGEMRRLLLGRKNRRTNNGHIR
jgi:hypothetical protein